MIRKLGMERPVFVLDTLNTTYAFRVMETGQLKHLYYGKKITIREAVDAESLVEKHAFAPGNSIWYDNDHPEMSLEDVLLETSGVGKGDIREPMVQIIAADGSTTTDFVYSEAEISTGKAEFEGLPGSFDEENQVAQLTITMKDKNHGYTLNLNYWTYDECDVITRNAVFINDSQEEVSLQRLLSLQLDVNECNFNITSFHGGWDKEMERYDVRLTAGKFVNDTVIGHSSSRSNPFIMASRDGADEDQGDVFAFNLIYSGNHYEAAEVSSFQKTRFVTGINPNGFVWKLAAGEKFTAPEAVMTFSTKGFNGMSQHMHDFVKEHIVRGVWAKKDRPVLLNSWEANYFDIDEGKLVKLAKAGKEAGMELFVMDDGWFGTRSDDHQALGDWYVNTKKLPGGLKGLCKKINDLGMDLGIWVEPEMVNVDSDLYRAHPDWAMAIPGMDHSEGRTQRFLDLANPEVVDYMIESMTRVFSEAPIKYVKWDMNRIFSDVYSPYLAADRQQETPHRYMLGFYRMLKTLTESFPEILFEGCASGGNRFDLGALCYYPQIWASDNTDAMSRLTIQNGYSYGYPVNTFTSHVSACPNHQTLRVTPLETRFNVAAFGVFGYECNLCDMGSEELAAVKAQVELYKKYRHTLQHGRFYRGRCYGNQWEWMAVSQDRKESVGMLTHKELRAGEPYEYFQPRGLDPETKYHFFGRELKFDVRGFGSLINTVAPVHVKQDSLVHNVIAKFVKMDSEKEDYKAYGDTLMYGGVQLAPSFVGTGYNEKVRYFTDYASRLYFMEAEDDQVNVPADESDQETE